MATRGAASRSSTTASNGWRPAVARRGDEPAGGGEGAVGVGGRSRAVSRSSTDSPAPSKVTRCVPGRGAGADAHDLEHAARVVRVVVARRPARVDGRDPARDAPGRCPTGGRLAAPVPLDDRRLEPAGPRRTSRPRPRRAGGTAPRRARGSARRRPRRRCSRSRARTAGDVRVPAGRGEDERPVAGLAARGRGCRRRHRRATRRRRHRRAVRVAPTVDRAPDDGRARPAGGRGAPRSRSRRAVPVHRSRRCMISVILSRIEPRFRRSENHKGRGTVWCPRPLVASGPGGSVVRRSRAVRAPGPEPSGWAATASSSRRKRRGERATLLAQCARSAGLMQEISAGTA